MIQKSDRPSAPFVAGIWVVEVLYLGLIAANVIFNTLPSYLISAYYTVPLFLLWGFYPLYAFSMRKSVGLGAVFFSLVPTVITGFCWYYASYTIIENGRLNILSIVSFIYLPILLNRYKGLKQDGAAALIAWLTPRVGILLFLQWLPQLKHLDSLPF